MIFAAYRKPSVFVFAYCRPRPVLRIVAVNFGLGQWCVRHTLACIGYLSYRSPFPTPPPRLKVRCQRPMFDDMAIRSQFAYWPIFSDESYERSRSVRKVLSLIAPSLRVDSSSRFPRPVHAQRV